MDFEWILDTFWRRNSTLWEAKMLLKIGEKINEDLKANYDQETEKKCRGGDSPLGAWSSEFA